MHVEFEEIKEKQLRGMVSTFTSNSEENMCSEKFGETSETLEVL
jgi:hypothetical protein